MLIRFRVENHRAVSDEQELSLVAAPVSEHAEALVRAERYDFDLLRVAAVFGANASGKSTLFEALAFMRSAVVDSQARWKPDAGVPRAPFALDPSRATEPSRFAVDLLLSGVRYEYGFAADSGRVLEEWLYAYPKGRRQEWFTRDAAREEEFRFSRLFPGENRLISTVTRQNSLFLSAAAQNNHEGLRELYAWFSQGLAISRAESRSSVDPVLVEMCRHEVLRKSILSILEAADLGIVAIDLYEEDGVAAFGRMIRVFQGEPLTQDPGALRQDPVDPGFTRVRFQHRTRSGAGVALPFEHESSGTKAMFALGGAVVVALASGRTLVVDELDRSLHPHLACKVVKLFNDPSTNPRGAQLIFNTHDTNLLDTSILRRDQIWFTEKDDDGATHLFPLTDFRARKYENIERGYLQGRYGAVPSVRTPDLLRKAAG